MSKQKTKIKSRSNYEVYKSLRKDWGEINPVTRIIPDKRKKPPKHKSKDTELD